MHTLIQFETTKILEEKMVDQFSNILNMLMGPNRNATSFTEATSEHFSKPYVKLEYLTLGLQVRVSFVLPAPVVSQHEVRHGLVFAETRRLLQATAHGHARRRKTSLRKRLHR